LWARPPKRFQDLPTNVRPYWRLLNERNTGVQNYSNIYGRKKFCNFDTRLLSKNGFPDKCLGVMHFHFNLEFFRKNAALNCSFVNKSIFCLHSLKSKISDRKYFRWKSVSSKMTSYKKLKIKMKRRHTLTFYFSMQVFLSLILHQHSLKSVGNSSRCQMAV
jgi:hypothetical protein